jgi:ParB family chromosome partitioning protein
MGATGGKRSFKGVSRTDAFLFDPEELILVLDEQDPLYDPRVHLPLDEALVLNVMVNGVIEPVIITVNTPKVIIGRQRVKAAREANKRLAAEGKETIRIPALRRRGEDSDLYGVLITENELRRGDTPLEQVRKAQKLLNLGKRPEEVCIAFGWKLPTLKVMLKLLDCDPKVKHAVATGQVSVSAAARLAPLERPAQRKALEKLVAESGGKRATVRQTAQAVSGKTEIIAPRKKEIEALLGRALPTPTARAFAAGAAWGRGLLSAADAEPLLLQCALPTEVKE